MAIAKISPPAVDSPAAGAAAAQPKNPFKKICRREVMIMLCSVH